METTIGQHVLASVLAYQLGISADRAMKLYVRGHELSSSWELLCENLLRSGLAYTSVQGSPPPASGPQIVRPRPGRKRAQDHLQAGVEKMNPREARE